MSLPLFAEAVRRIPSITTWTRLEPLPREGSMQRSLQAQVRDPLWFLTRQWQVGEFLGDDAGSPVQATLSVEQRSLTTYRPNGPNVSNDASPIALDPGLPVEVHVERETVTPRLYGAVQLGLYFEKLIRSSGLPGPDKVIVIAAFRLAFPLAAAPPDPALADNDGLRFRALAAGRVTDGEALYAAALAVANGQAPPQPLPAQATDPQVAPVLADFIAYRQSLFSEPAGDASWQPQQLAYDFALGSPAPDRNLSLRAEAFPGGHLDWYSFDLDDQGPLTQENPAAITTADFNFLPNHVVFRGMPDPRWWNFEDSVTDFGQLDADHVDLAKLLVMEFALIYGNDWFSVPVPTPIGTLARVTTLVVTDTFGVRTLIRPAEETQVNAAGTPWSMYKLSGPGSRSDFIVMAPTLGLAEDADALEEVLFLRDDMAAMAWAVEHQLQGDLDAPMDAYEMYLRQPDPPPAAPPGGPKIYYTLATPVPGNWVPMLPVRSPQGELFLRRGTVETTTGAVSPTAHAAILEPQHPFFVADRVVSRAGALVDRHFRRARGADGGTFVWLARKSTQGRGPGWSGLRFDAVRDF